MMGRKWCRSLTSRLLWSSQGKLFSTMLLLLFSGSTPPGVLSAIAPVDTRVAADRRESSGGKNSTPPAGLRLGRPDRSQPLVGGARQRAGVFCAGTASAGDT